MIVKGIDVYDKDLYLIPGDIHFDKQDDEALSLMLRVAQEFGITGACLIGDSMDSAGLSRHGRPAKNFRFGAGTIKAEEKAARPFVEALNAIVASNRHRPGGLHVLTGNHCKWYEAVQDDYPGFLDTPWHEHYNGLFDGWHVWGEETAVRMGSLLVCHGHRLRGSLSRNSAAAVLGNYPGQNTLYGHTHRVDSCITPTFKYGKPVAHGAWTIGHMRDIEHEIKDPFLGPHAERHSQGFALVSFHHSDERVRFHVSQVTIMRKSNGRPYCIANGEYFE